MILTQFHVTLLIALLMAIFYIGYIIGNYDRRMPKETNLNDRWWEDESSDVEGHTDKMQVEIMRKI